MKKHREYYARQWLRKNRQPRSAGDPENDLFTDDRYSVDLIRHHQSSESVIFPNAEVFKTCILWRFDTKSD
jgi:hypothetical protein